MDKKRKALKNVDCPNCGGTIDIYSSGRRVESVTCGYCGSVLDTHKQFSIIKKFTEIHRPYLPLPIGRSGKLHGVEVTIIGVIQYESLDDRSTWLEYLLYSPTHGYAWLEYEAGHFVFSRRTRDLPSNRVIKTERATFKACGHKFKVFDFYSARVTYVEGEMTSVITRGDKIKLVDAIAPPYGYSIETSNKEKEYYFSEYLQPEDVKKAFKVSTDFPKPDYVHGCQPFKPGGFFKGLVNAGQFFAPLVFALLVITLFMGYGTKVVSTSISANEYLSQEGGATRDFTLTDTDRLVELDLYANYQNAWGWFDIEILKDGVPAFNMSKQISYYSGYEGGEHWSEGSRSASAYFKIDEPGRYSLRVWGEGGQGNRGNTPQTTNLAVSIREGVIVTRYYVIMLIISALAWMSIVLYRMHFEALRWGSYDEEDD